MFKAVKIHFLTQRFVLELLSLG